MNQKKCPKCGEMNPGEAVMCWACYTPLGAAVAIGPGGISAATTAGAPPIVHSDEDQKKGIPPWQLGVVGVGLLVILGIGAMTLMGGSSEDDSTLGNSVAGTGGTYDPPAPGPGPNNTGTQTGGVAPPAPGGGNVEPLRARFTVISPSNPDQAWNIIGIVPVDGNVGPQQGAGLAKFAYMLLGKGNSKPTQIFVFADRQAGEQFKELQVSRRSAALGTQEYVQMSPLWTRCLAYYEVTGSRVRLLYPQRAGANWWAARG